MRAAIIDEDSFVTNVVEVSSYDSWPGCIPAQNSGGIGDWWHDGEFITIWDPRHPKYTGPYIPPSN